MGGTVLTTDFVPATVAPGDTTTLTFRLTNSSPTSPVTAISFSNNLAQFMSGIAPTSTSDRPDICGTGSLLSHDRYNELIVFSGGSLPAGGSCDFSVDLVVPQGAFSGT
ncbi:MAG: DUF7933 domain-containing protein, partial [Verrucomicrobiales bacterium]